MVERVPTRHRKPLTREGKRLQDEIGSVARAVTSTRISQDAAQRVTLGMTAIWPDDITPPSTWLRCDGGSVRRQAYPELYNAIGVAFGPGDGSTTFDLPDLTAWEPAGMAAYLFAGR